MWTLASSARDEQPSEGPGQPPYGITSQRLRRAAPSGHEPSDLGQRVEGSVLSSVACELATNACLHSRSREPGGRFTVRVQRDDARLRVEVTDEGGHWALAAHADAQQPNGRGLLIVSQLATAWGRAGDAGTGWTAWFEL